MDKYEYNVKLEQIKKLIKKKDYATAARIADTIDWYKVKNNQTIVMIADVYEASGRYDQSKENLKLAYDRSGLGRQIAYKLVKICIKCGALEEAEDFYDDFVSAAPKDISRYILEYELARAKGDPIEQQISILEKYLEEDMDDKWAFELAKLYHKSGQRDKCIRQCDTVMLWFSDGKYVERAMELKMIYTPLNKSQKERYEARWREKTGQPGLNAEEIQIKEVDVSNKYNTQNIQEALKESMDELYSEEKKENNRGEGIFRPTMPSPEYEENQEEYQEEALYEEAEEAVAGTDDYISKMNQSQQYSEASYSFAQKPKEHGDDLGDTKVFVTTRTKKNMGDTKVFAPIRQTILERVSFEEPANEAANEAYILEEKTIKNEFEPVYEEEPKENPEEVWENPEEPEEELEEIWGNPEDIAGEAEEELEDEFAEAEELPEEELEDEFEEAEELSEEELEDEFAEAELPEEELEGEYEEAEEEKELLIEKLEENLQEDPDVLSEEDLEELLKEDITEEEQKEEPKQEIEEAFEAEELPEEIQKELEEFVAKDSSEISENEPEAAEIEPAEIQKAPDPISEAAVSKEPEADSKENFEEAFSVEDFFNNAGGYYTSEKQKEEKEETAPKEEAAIAEPEYEYEQEEFEAPEELGDPEEYEDQYQELRETTIIEQEYEYVPEELGDPEEYEDQYQELKETTIIEQEYEYEPEAEELSASEEYEEPEAEEEYQPKEEALEEYPSQPKEEAYEEQAQPEEAYEEQAQPKEEAYEEQTQPKEEVYEEQAQPKEEAYEEQFQPKEEAYEEQFQPEAEESDAVEESESQYPQPEKTDAKLQEEFESVDDLDEEDKVLTHDEIKTIIKDFIGKYSGVQGLDKQMLKTLQNIIVDDSCNIIIMGDAKSGKTSLGLDIIKVVNKIKRNNDRRIAKISADKLIGKELSVYFTRLRGSDIYIENISMMDDDTLAELLAAMDKDLDKRIVVIEDEKINAEKFLHKHKKIREYFANQIVVKQNKIRDWVEVAREYAEEQGYEIDEMGMLALHAKIDQLYAVTLVIQKNHVDAIIDNAIKKAGKGGLLKRLFGKRKEKILTEEHFSL